MRRALLIIGFLLLISIEIGRVYFIMPFPGSQKSNSIGFAYWLNNNSAWLRILGLLLIIYPFISIIRYSKTWKKLMVVLPLIIYGIIFYFFNYRFEADKMFYQPKVLSFSSDTLNKKSNSERLVIGVVLNGKAKAYPIELIGYHHQVRDDIGGTSVMITYCTVCRTGRVYSPTVNGKNETFRLVGMDHFNAMFEDATTKSWWQQATGVAVAGPLKGKSLKEIPSFQMSWAAWVRQHPNSEVMQPDTSFKKQYEDLSGYDKGTIKSSLEKRDSGSWKFKSWVIGVVMNDKSKAYDWNNILNKRVINDSINHVAILIAVETDSTSFHAWNRTVNGTTLTFRLKDNTDTLTDTNTKSLWDMNGHCVEGKLKGNYMVAIQAYQEFWHSWKTFHPGSSK